jgi:hypothetical protein
MDIDVRMAHLWNYLTSDFITHSELAIQKYDTIRYSKYCEKAKSMQVV